MAQRKDGRAWNAGRSDETKVRVARVERLNRLGVPGWRICELVGISRRTLFNYLGRLRAPGRTPDR